MRTIYPVRRLYPAALVFVTLAFIVAMIMLLAVVLSPVGHTFAQGKVVRITLIDENGSGEDGSAQLTDLPPDSIKIELSMRNEPDGGTQPAGISEGSCATIDPDVATAYSLESVTEAKSTSTIKVGLDELMAKKYSIVVYKSASDKTIISCGNLPTAAISSTAPLTLDQSLNKLLDQAHELEGYVKKKEVDGSKNAYAAYHTTFAGVEDAIKAKSADTHEALEAAMNDVNDAVDKGNWDKAAENAEKLVQAIETAQKSLAGSSSEPVATAVPASTGSGSSSLPATGVDDWATLSVEVAFGAMLMLMAGIAMWRPAAR